MRYSALFALAGLTLSASFALAPGAVAAEPSASQASMVPNATVCNLDGTVWDYGAGRPSTDQKANAYCEGLRDGEARGAKAGRQCQQKSYPLWWPNPDDAQRARDRGFKSGYDRSYQREWHRNSCQNQPQPEPYYPPVH